MIVTIDGPAASGKSSAARALAQKLSFYYLNSGMLYRALGYCLLYNGNVPLKELRGCDMKLYSKCLEELRYTYDICNGKMALFVKDVDVTALLKEPIIDKAASLVGENKQARIFLLTMQRELVDHHDTIAEGRDAGSAIFPQATIKFFLTARPEVRALRWLKDQKNNDNITKFEDALRTIQERDERDSNRSDAPLHIFADNIIVDNSNLSLEQTVQKMFSIIT